MILKYNDSLTKGDCIILNMKDGDIIHMTYNDMFGKFIFGDMALSKNTGHVSECRVFNSRDIDSIEYVID